MKATIAKRGKRSCVLRACCTSFLLSCCGCVDAGEKEKYHPVIVNASYYHILVLVLINTICMYKLIVILFCYVV